MSDRRTQPRQSLDIPKVPSAFAALEKLFGEDSVYTSAIKLYSSHVFICTAGSPRWIGSGGESEEQVGVKYGVAIRVGVRKSGDA